MTNGSDLFFIFLSVSSDFAVMEGRSCILKYERKNTTNGGPKRISILLLFGILVEEVNK